MTQAHFVRSRKLAQIVSTKSYEEEMPRIRKTH